MPEVCDLACELVFYIPSTRIKRVQMDIGQHCPCGLSGERDSSFSPRPPKTMFYISVPIPPDLVSPYCGFDSEVRLEQSKESDAYPPLSQLDRLVLLHGLGYRESCY